MSLDPKSLEFAIKESILAYPCLFQIREQVLCHFFFVLGNGYDWWDGRLRETCEDEKHQVVEKMLIDGVPDEEIRAWVKAKDDDRVEKSLRDLQDLCKKHGIAWEPPPLKVHPLRIYPLCNLSTIMNLPDHIRPDWLAGAEEAVSLIETTQSYDEKATEKNRALIPTIRERIAVLKANQSTQGGGGASMMMAI